MHPPETHKKKKKTSDATLARKQKRKKNRPGESRKLICEARA
jgi:hypothetical protein